MNVDAFIKLSSSINWFLYLKIKAADVQDAVRLSIFPLFWIDVMNMT